MNRKRGFSLVEVLMCVGILAALFVGLTSLNVYCFDLLETSKNTTTALNIARTRIEEVKSMTFNAIRSAYVVAPGGPQIIILLPATYGLDGTLRLEVTDVNGSGLNLVDVRVVVCWKQKGGRIVGEDTNLNRILNGTEDSNGDGKLSSPVELITAIAKRQ